jgi:hypothetical protein
MLKVAAVAASIMLAAPAAQAAEIVTTGPNATTVTARMDSGANNSFNIGFSDANLENPFNELLTFTTDVAGQLNIFFGSTATNATNDTDFSGAFLTGTGIVSPVSVPEILADPNETRALNNFNVGAGTFTLRIEGTPGTQNGAFGGNVAFVASPVGLVPEPATWAMMLLGFGAVGYSMRRRKVSYARVQAI